jgi:hypothetical protein
MRNAAILAGPGKRWRAVRNVGWFQVRDGENREINTLRRRGGRPPELACIGPGMRLGSKSSVRGNIYGASRNDAMATVKPARSGEDQVKSLYRALTHSGQSPWENMVWVLAVM